MSNFVKEWETAKKAFLSATLTELKAGGDQVPAEIKAEILGMLKAETGMTAALKLVDAAFAKKHRAVVMSALTKVHAIIEKGAMAIQKVALKAGSESAAVADAAASKALSEIQMLGIGFKGEMTGFETKIAKALESLQEEKDPNQQKINIISLEGDMDGAINKFKKDIKPLAAEEKVHKVLEILKPAEKAMQAYSKAAARTEVREAQRNLLEFLAEVGEIDKYAKKLHAKKPAPSDDYLDAADSLCKALRALRDQRAEVSKKNLNALMDAAH